MLPQRQSQPAGQLFKYYSVGPGANANKMKREQVPLSSSSYYEQHPAGYNEALKQLNLTEDQHQRSNIVIYHGARKGSQTVQMKDLSAK